MHMFNKSFYYNYNVKNIHLKLTRTLFYITEMFKKTKLFCPKLFLKTYFIMSVLKSAVTLNEKII